MKLTKRDASRQQRMLRGRGVYKPYVSQDGDALVVESYPLTARIARTGFTPENGPFSTITVTDCSLQRLGQPGEVARAVVLFGQPAEQVLCPILTSLHPPAYARAKAQDEAALAQSKT